GHLGDQGAQTLPADVADGFHPGSVAPDPRRVVYPPVPMTCVPVYPESRLAAMDLATFNSDMERRAELARRLGRSPDYLWQLGIGWRGKRPSPELALAIDRETATWGRRFRVRKETLRPDLWG